MDRLEYGDLIRKGKSLFLAYDEGLEEGPDAFTKRSVDPQFILDVALEGEYTGIILNPGVAAHYYTGAYRDVPLIVKLNARTSLPHQEPIARQVCSVNHAMKLGAAAVAYTIYDGSRMEPEIFKEFGVVVEEAHDHNLPVLAILVPRGQDVQDPASLMAYGARIGLELGADFIKIAYNGDLPHLQWTRQCAGRTRLLVSNRAERPDGELIREAYDTTVEADVAGLVVGRNVWRHEKPFSLSKALGDVVYARKKPSQVLHLLQESL